MSCVVGFYFCVQWVPLRWELIVRFVYVGGIGDHCCLNFLFIVILVWKQKNPEFNFMPPSIWFFSYFIHLKKIYLDNIRTLMENIKCIFLWHCTCMYNVFICNVKNHKRRSRRFSWSPLWSLRLYRFLSLLNMNQVPENYILVSDRIWLKFIQSMQFDCSNRTSVWYTFIYIWLYCNQCMYCQNKGLRKDICFICLKDDKVSW